MMLADVIFAGRAWWPWAVGLSAAALVAAWWSYRHTLSVSTARWIALGLKIVAILALATCLVEPLVTGTRPRPGSNLFLVVTDNSRSLQLAGRPGQTRAAQVAARLKEGQDWSTRLEQDFEVRRYTFDSTLHPVSTFKDVPFDGEASTIAGSLTALQERFRDLPVAGILLLTDGNATDLEASPLDAKSLPPVYPVMLGSEEELPDVSLTRVQVSQTNFDAAPVTINTEISARALGERKLVVRIIGEDGQEVEKRTVKPEKDKLLAERFLIKPDKVGVVFYTVKVGLEGEENAGGKDQPKSAEATLANNSRLAMVDRGGGPYRVLYVSGRPNWEFKFLRRALEEDDEVNLVGLIRIAKKEPKFTFLGRAGERTNPLFRGFGNKGDEQLQEYDQPVLMRVTDEKGELASGFPKSAEELYRYHALVLDDIESGFFSQDQQSLIQKFVGQRGGGILMLGGDQSFAEGNWQRTPVGEMLPVYLDRATSAPAEEVRLKLTREGWLQPWVRVRTTEPEEETRLAEMPPFKALNAIDSIKPGASVLAQVESEGGQVHPALVVQQFGLGRAAALLVGDLWRWHLKRPEGAPSDLSKSWRQTVRWLVSDVPRGVDVEVRRTPGGSTAGVELAAKIRDKLFEPQDNATVSVTVKTPDTKTVELTTESSSTTAGEYVTTFIPRSAGPYHATIVAKAEDGSEIGRRETGWSVEPETDEFRSLAANKPFLESLATESGGEMVELDGLESFVSSLPNRKIPVTESWTYPFWHQSSVFAFVMLCLAGEWALRRWKGLP